MALYNAWRAMRRGDHHGVQRAFRARIGAQAFTVCAIVAGGAYYGADREKRKELIKLEAQGRAEERHQKWLRELEVRDEEDKALQDHLKRRKQRVQAKKAEDREKAGEAPASGLKAETTADGEGQVPVESSKEKSSVLGALSQTGSWFGTGKAKDSEQKDAEPKKSESKDTEAKALKAKDSKPKDSKPSADKKSDNDKPSK